MSIDVNAARVVAKGLTKSRRAMLARIRDGKSVYGGCSSMGARSHATMAFRDLAGALLVKNAPHAERDGQKYAGELTPLGRQVSLWIDARGDLLATLPTKDTA